MKVHSIDDFTEWFEVLATVGRAQVAMMQLAPGQATGVEAEAHAHSEQVLLVLRGEVEGQIGEAKVSVKEREFVIVPAGVKHRFVNSAPDSALTFNVYAPAAYPVDAKG